MQKLSSREKKNVLLLLQKKTYSFENRVALGIKETNGWNELTFAKLGELSRKLANYLIELELKRDDRIVILSESRPEWGVSLFASVLAGGITVPLDIKLTEHELFSIMSNCQPRFLLVSGKFLDVALKMKEKVSSIENIILMDNDSSDKKLPSIYTIEPKTVNKLRHRNPNKTALIIYTSGTTGNPKGVMTTFGNILSQIEGIESLYNFGEKDSVLSILPLNHLFELTAGFFAMLNWGTSIYYSKSLNPADILTAMKDKDVTFMVAVPAFLKLLMLSIEKEVRKGSKFSQILFNSFYSIAKYLPSKTIKKILFYKVHQTFGGRFKGFIAGGAAVDVEIIDFFNRMGIIIYQGYGLTETSPVVSVNYPKNNKFGSVGKPLKDVRVKIDTTGEILIKGPNVMKGYYNSPELTDEVFDEEGWFKSGDIGEIDNDGFLYITGRIKNLIVLSGGKKIHPEEVESVLEKSGKFLETVVIGHKKQSGDKENGEEVCVVIVPTEDVINTYPDKNEMTEAIRNEVKTLSKQLASYKRPTKTFVRFEPLPRTTTRKVKRREIMEWVNTKI